MARSRRSLTKISGVTLATGAIAFLLSGGCPPPPAELVDTLQRGPFLLFPNDGEFGGAPKLIALRIEPNEITFDNPDQRSQVRVIGTFSRGPEQDVTDQVGDTLYDSDDAEISTVSKDGLIAPLARGTTTISAMNSGVMATAQVDVTYCRPRSPKVESANQITSDDMVTLRGSTDPGSMIEVVGPAGMTTMEAAGGDFEFEVPLKANRANALFVTAIADCGARSSPRTIHVTNDNMPPQIFIDFPPDGIEYTFPTVDVAGRVSDLLSGYEGLRVTVNGSRAEVDEGIGTNGTFFLRGLELEDGENVIRAVAHDSAGNEQSFERTITRVDIPDDAPRFEIVSGGAQTAPIHQYVADPLVVRVVDADGNPFAEKIVTFEVFRSDGRLAEAKFDGENRDDPATMIYQTRTDDQGMAQAFYKLGGDAGCGNNRVGVDSTSIAGTVFFCASADKGPRKQINIGTGNNQRIEVGGTVTEPLRAWVSDSCNGIADVPVTFRVTRGDGKVRENDAMPWRDEVTVNTTRTGHAQVDFLAGPEVGNNFVEADYEDNPTGPATFVVYGLRRTDGPAIFTGLILDNSNQPLGGAGVLLLVNGLEVGTATSTDQGQFRIENIETSGKAELFVDATTIDMVNGAAVPALTRYPDMHYETVVVANAENSLPMPVLLPPLDTRNDRTYFANQTEDLELTCEGMEGLKLIVKAGTTVTLADGVTKIGPDFPFEAGNDQRPGQVVLALNQVHHDNIPMPMPDGAAPPFAWTFQPALSHFDPPVQIEYPNMSALPPGAVSYFLSFNHETNKFEIIASGTVVEDGSISRSDPGVGISVSGWGCNCPPYAVTGDCCHAPPNTCNDCDCNNGSPSPTGQPANQCTVGNTCDDGDDCTTSDQCTPDGCKGTPRYPSRNRLTAAEIELVGSWAGSTIVAGPCPTGGSPGCADAEGITHEGTTYIDQASGKIKYDLTKLQVSGTLYATLCTPRIRQRCNGCSMPPMLDGALANVNATNYCDVLADLRSPGVGCWHTLESIQAHERFHRDSDLPRILMPLLKAAEREIEMKSISCPRDGALADVEIRLFELEIKECIKKLDRQFREKWSEFARIHSANRNDSAYDAGLAVLLPIINAIERRARDQNWPSCDGLTTFKPQSVSQSSDNLVAELIVDVVTPLLAIGDFTQVQATVVYENGTTSTLSSDEVSYRTFDSEVITVNEDGIVSAVGSGIGVVVASIAVDLDDPQDLPISTISPIITVRPSDDFDMDKLPDNWERQNGLDPSNPLDANIDNDGDGLDTLGEFRWSCDPNVADTDDDGLNDGVEVANRLDPLNALTLAQGEWSLNIGSAIVATNSLRSTTVHNVSAADNFGEEGPGTPPDFVSDDFLRAVASISIDGSTYYGISDFFQLRNARVLELSDFTITDQPPLSVESMVVAPAMDQPSVLTRIDETSQLQVLATLTDGTTEADLTERTKWTVYRTSNPRVVTVGPNGLATAVGMGTAFITAVNDGATAVTRLIVVPGDPLTTIEGRVRFSDNRAAVGATISVFGLPNLTAVTDDRGMFTLADVPTQITDMLTIRARLEENEMILLGSITGIQPQPGMLTDAGIIYLSETGGRLGPMILSGMDPEDHSYTGGQSPGAGYVMVRDIMHFVATNSALPNAPEFHVLMLGGNVNGVAVTVTRSIAGELGFQFTQVNGDAINDVDLNPASTPYDMIYMPTSASETTSGLTNEDLIRINMRGAEIIDFVNAGGGLAAFVQQGETAYEWFPLQGLETVDVHDSSGIELTPQGEFILSESATMVEPFHGAFVGPPGFFGLDVLARESSGERRALIIGGIAEIAR